jgi:hypothetical protein
MVDPETKDPVIASLRDKARWLVDNPADHNGNFLPANDEGVAR